MSRVETARPSTDSKTRPTTSEILTQAVDSLRVPAEAEDSELEQPGNVHPRVDGLDPSWDENPERDVQADDQPVQ